MNKLRVVLSLITRDSGSGWSDKGRGSRSAATERRLGDFLRRRQLRHPELAVARLNSQVQVGAQRNSGRARWRHQFPQVGRAAVSAGIAWVVLNRDASSLADLRRDFQAPAFAVSSDHKQVGRIQAQQLAAILPEAATVLCIQGPSNSLAAQHRLVSLEGAKPSRMTLEDPLKAPTGRRKAAFRRLRGGCV